MTENTSNRGLYKFKSYGEMLELPAPTWLIEGLLPAQGLADLYGDSGVGKSFLALDWSAHVATGRDWLGNTVQQGGVAYICSEGPHGCNYRCKSLPL